MHYVLAGLMALFVLFAGIHWLLGAAMVNGALPDPNNPEEIEAVGWILIL